TPAYLREYEDYKGNKASFYHCDNCATQAYRYFRQEARDHERVQEEAQKKKEQAEQSSGKLTSSTSNATDADNQTKKGKKLEEQNEILEELIAKQEELQRLLAEELEKETPTIICAKCGQNISGKYWKNKQDQNVFCSESCYDGYYATEKCDDCGLKITGK
ncbi:5952_t:CDS:2, partial [Racocetra persica]